MKKLILLSIFGLFISAQSIAGESVLSVKENTLDAQVVTGLTFEELFADLELTLDKKPPRGQNYIENGHLFVWYKGKYLDMGEYHP